MFQVLALGPSSQTAWVWGLACPFEGDLPPRIPDPVSTCGNTCSLTLFYLHGSLPSTSSVILTIGLLDGVSPRSLARVVTVLDGNARAQGSRLMRADKSRTQGPFKCPNVSRQPQGTEDEETGRVLFPSMRPTHGLAPDGRSYYIIGYVALSLLPMRGQEAPPLTFWVNWNFHFKCRTLEFAPTGFHLVEVGRANKKSLRQEGIPSRPPSPHPAPSVGGTLSGRRALLDGWHAVLMDVRRYFQLSPFPTGKVLLDPSVQNQTSTKGKT